MCTLGHAHAHAQVAAEKTAEVADTAAAAAQPAAQAATAAEAATAATAAAAEAAAPAALVDRKKRNARCKLGPVTTFILLIATLLKARTFVSPVLTSLSPATLSLAALNFTALGRTAQGYKTIGCDE